ncbi:hypothetical protein LMG2828_04699 [Achromobacter piechaudii]|uniref:hypothetical protein n=1 Tax=Achromobacter piechaudii TaxID=72556 RepID=UPI00146828BD|nr:hypothetical protein [Achromobacter piechaudii]CAB3904959.1 hypothetical protein LMG2828_04699 [Achromobacter piechaudii]
MASYGNDNPQGGFFSALQDPANQGLLAAGLAMLGSARGPNSQGAIGMGGLTGLQAFQQAQTAGDMQAYRKAQIQKLEQDAQKQNRIMAALGRITGDTGGTMTAPGGAPAGSPTPGGPLLAGPVPAGSPGLLGGAAPSGGGGFNLSLPDVMALKAMGGPDLFDMYKYATDGVKRESGAAYRNPVTGAVEYGPPKLPEGMELVMGPNGPMARPVQGYSDANAAAKGAEADAQARAQAGYDLVDVPDGKGGTVKMPRLNALQRLGGASGDRATAAGQPDRFGRSSSPADQAFEKSVAEASADTYNTLQKSGMNADKQIANYQRIGSLLDGISGSSLSNVGMTGAKLLNSIGLEVDPNLPNKEAAAAIGNQLALQLRDPANGGGMPGAMSDADRNFLMQSVPGLNQTDAGRKQLIDYQVRVLERNKDVAQAARKWRQKYGRLDSLDPKGNDFDTALAEWSAANPLFEAK